MRPLDKVIEATLKLIPADYDKRDLLSKQLESIKESSLYAAPEMQVEWWYKFGLLLQTTLGDPEGIDWKEAVVDLVTGKKDYQEVLDA